MLQTQNNDEPSARVPAAKVYSVPRRYDLATLFAVSLAYSLAFGVMRMCNLSATAFAAVAAFVTCVGLGQAILFKGEAPRAASLLVGMAFCPVAAVAVAVQGAGPDVGRVVAEMVPFALILSIPGAFAGYFTGVAVGGVFLIAEYVRKIARLVTGYDG